MATVFMDCLVAWTRPSSRFSCSGKLREQAVCLITQRTSSVYGRCKMNGWLCLHCRSALACRRNCRSAVAAFNRKSGWNLLVTKGLRQRTLDSRTPLKSSRWASPMMQAALGAKSQGAEDDERHDDEAEGHRQQFLGSREEPLFGGSVSGRAIYDRPISIFDRPVPLIYKPGSRYYGQRDPRYDVGGGRKRDVKRETHNQQQQQQQQQRQRTWEDDFAESDRDWGDPELDKLDLPFDFKKLKYMKDVPDKRTISRGHAAAERGRGRGQYRGRDQPEEEEEEAAEGYSEPLDPKFAKGVSKELDEMLQRSLRAKSTGSKMGRGHGQREEGGATSLGSQRVSDVRTPRSGGRGTGRGTTPAGYQSDPTPGSVAGSMLGRGKGLGSVVVMGQSRGRGNGLVPPDYRVGGMVREQSASPAGFQGLGRGKSAWETGLGIKAGTERANKERGSSNDSANGFVSVSEDPFSTAADWGAARTNRASAEEDEDYDISLSERGYDVTRMRRSEGWGESDKVHDTQEDADYRDSDERPLQDLRSGNDDVFSADSSAQQLAAGEKGRPPSARRVPESKEAGYKDQPTTEKRVGRGRRLRWRQLMAADENDVAEETLVSDAAVADKGEGEGGIVDEVEEDGEEYEEETDEYEEVEDESDDDGTSLRHEAQPESVRAKQWEIDFDKISTAKWSPVHSMAAGGSSVPLVDLCLKRGLDVDSVDKDGLVPIQRAVICGREKTVRTLVEYGADPFVKDREGASLLHFGVQAKEVDVVRSLLKYGLDVNQPDMDGWTPLHVASLGGWPSMITFLLHNGADPRAVTNDGTTPLELIERYGPGYNFLKGQNALRVALGLAELFEQAPGAEQAYDNLVVSDANSDGDAGPDGALQMAAQGGYTAEDKVRIAEFFKNFGKDRPLKWMPLHTLAGAGNTLPLIHLLVANGVSIEMKDRDGRTPLERAVWYRQENTARQMLKLVLANPNVKDVHGATPLHYAAQNGSNDLCKQLARFGANVNAQDNDGWTPLHVAVQMGRWDTVERLLKARADWQIENAAGLRPADIAQCYGKSHGFADLTKMLTKPPKKIAQAIHQSMFDRGKMKKKRKNKMKKRKKRGTYFPPEITALPL